MTIVCGHTPCDIGHSGMGWCQSFQSGIAVPAPSSMVANLINTSGEIRGVSTRTEPSQSAKFAPLGK